MNKLSGSGTVISKDVCNSFPDIVDAEIEDQVVLTVAGLCVHRDCMNCMNL